MAPFDGLRARVHQLGVRVCVIAHHVDEAVEEVGRVVGAGGGFGVVLHREGGQPAVRIFELQALDDVVVQADVADLGGAVRGRRSAPLAVASTANPWLCAVTSTLRVVRSITGWLMPRWP